MSIDPIAFLSPLSMPSVAPVAGQAQAPSGDFARMFTQQIGETNRQLGDADRAVQQLAAGEAPNLHEVMIKLEEARVSLQLLMQVRNRVLEAYQDLSRMQM